MDLTVGARLTGPPAPPAEFNLEVNIENRGPDAARDATVSVVMPSDVGFLEASAPCGVYLAGRVDCTSLGPGSFGVPDVGKTVSFSLRFEVRTNTSSSPREFVITIQHSQTDPKPGNDVAHAAIAE